MAKLRVHELAKKLNIQAKDIIGFLSEKNIEIKSHMSTLEEQEIDIVNSKFVKKETRAIVKTEVKTKAEESKAENVKAENVKTENVKTENVKTENVKTENVKTENVKTENVKEENVKSEEKDSSEKAEQGDRPKKKSSITAVFNPQNSKQGTPRRQNPQGHPANRRPAQERPQQENKPVANPAAPSEDRPVDSNNSRPQNVYANRPQGDRPQNVYANRPQGDRPQGDRPQNVYANRPQGDRPQGDRPQNVYANRPQGDRPQNVYANRPQGDRPQNVYANRPQGDRPQGDRPQNVYANRPQGNRPQGDRPQNVYANRPQGNRPQGDRPQNVYANRPQGDRPSNGNNRPQNVYANRPQGDRPANGNRPQGDRPQYNRPGTGNRPQTDRNGRPYANNQKSYQNNRPGANNNQGDRNGRPGGPNQFRGRTDQDAGKFNKESSTAANELRGKDTRDRSENRKVNNNNNNKRQEYDKLGSKKQERFVNLEKHGGKKRPQQQPKPEVKAEETVRTITLPDRLTIRELADKMKVQAAAIVKKLFLKGTMVTLNQEVSFDAAGEIALEFNCIAEAEVKVDVIAELLKEDDEAEGTLVARPPVVCVMGHVDHGKTSLLDAIRSTKVTDREAGGITQHIGASVVAINGQKITFLDTPGHEAFTAMRMRGANATDIAILVVAADDGVMPQTIEAINHARAAGIEIIVAVNKIDKPNANIERVKQELSEHQLIPEDWGGSTIFCPVSAHSHEGIDNLLEMILLTAEVCELKANPDRNARGLVIEAQLDKGRGVVATILVQKGTLKVGEPIACGSCFGKVRAMIDDEGRRVKEALPSTPVEILGLSGVPNAGEVFVSTDSEKEARTFAETFISEGKERLLEETKAKMSLDDLFSQIKSGNVKELDVIVKADVQGSVEAVKQSLEKLSNEEVVVKTIHGGVGAINESDVILASASNAIIIGFNVRPDVTAKATAEREGVDMRLYKVIYSAIEDVEAAMKGMLDPIFEEKIIGHAEVRQIFTASGIGSIAGSYILDGIFERGCKVRIKREGEQVYEGDLASIKRFKDDVKEVKTGYECGLVMDGFHDIQEFDQIEAYKMVEVPR